MRTLPLALFVVCVSRVQRRAALLLPARAAETVIRLTEVAPQSARGKCVLDHLAAANKDANYRLEDLRSRKIQTRIETIERETNLDFLAIRSFDAHGSLESTRPTGWINRLDDVLI
jgi:hypothetical protein